MNLLKTNNKEETLRAENNIVLYMGNSGWNNINFPSETMVQEENRWHFLSAERKQIISQ